MKETEREARWSLSQTWVAPPARLTHPVGHLKYISQHPLTSSNISDCRSNISSITAQSENRPGHFSYTSFFYSTHQPASLPASLTIAMHCRLISLRDSSGICSFPFISFLGSEMWHWPFQSGSSRTPVKLTSWALKYDLAFSAN